jgi:hypothetical protein
VHVDAPAGYGRSKKETSALLRQQTGRGSLLPFVRHFWHVLEPPKRDLVEGWPLEAICEHLEAITFGELKRLLINVPPGLNATAVLPSIVGQMVAARGADESTAWRQPIDLVALCEEAARQLPELVGAGPGTQGWLEHATLARELLGDDPIKIIDALKTAIRAGAAPADLGRSLAYAAALRVARFGNANEHSDWETAHHVFTYANAVHQMLGRIGSADIDSYANAVRGILHGAMALYLARYLNVPPARVPGEGDTLDDLPAEPEAIRTALLDAFDRQRQVDMAARLVARHLTLGHSPQALIATLARAVLREDSGFHAYQMLEAGVRQFTLWGNTDEGRHILIGVARYLAAHSPTERSGLQTADIARRLMRGGELHQEVGS